VKALVEHRAIEMGHARALLGLAERRKAQAAAAREVVAKGLSVRETERWSSGCRHRTGKPAPPAAATRTSAASRPSSPTSSAPRSASARRPGAASW
jgi:ParB-like chromosome segregation protein Spo0J